MRKDVVLRLRYDGSAAVLAEVWLEQYDRSGELVALVQLDHEITTADRRLLTQAATLVAHVGQLEAF